VKPIRLRRASDLVVRLPPAHHLTPHRRSRLPSLRHVTLFPPNVTVFPPNVTLFSRHVTVRVTPPGACCGHAPTPRPPRPPPRRTRRLVWRGPERSGSRRRRLPAPRGHAAGGCPPGPASHASRGRRRADESHTLPHAHALPE